MVGIGILKRFQDWKPFLPKKKEDWKPSIFGLFPASVFSMFLSTVNLLTIQPNGWDLI